MLSLARSRYTLLVQFVFLAANAVGVLLAIAYNASTPDLYPNNAHHKLGWIATAVVCAQVAIGLLGTVAGVMKRRGSLPRSGAEGMAFIPVSTANMAEHHRLHLISQPARLSSDSGQGTEPKTESLRGNSVSTPEDENIGLHDIRADYADDVDDLEPGDAGRHFGSRRFARLRTFVTSPVWRIFSIAYHVVDRTILILGFITLCTGIVTYGRFFVSPGITAENSTSLMRGIGRA